MLVTTVSMSSVSAVSSVGDISDIEGNADEGFSVGIVVIVTDACVVVDVLSCGVMVLSGKIREESNVVNSSDIVADLFIVSIFFIGSSLTSKSSTGSSSVSMVVSSGGMLVTAVSSSSFSVAVSVAFSVSFLSFVWRSVLTLLLNISIGPNAMVSSRLPFTLTPVPTSTFFSQLKIGGL